MLFKTQHPIVKQVAAAVEAFSTSWEKSCVTSAAMSDTSLPVVRSTLGLPETLTVEDGEYHHRPQSLQLPNSSNWNSRSRNNSDKRTGQDEMDSDGIFKSDRWIQVADMCKKVSVHPQDMFSEVKGLLLGGKEKSTVHQYRLTFEKFCLWCKIHNLESLPADPVTVALHFTESIKEQISKSKLKNDFLFYK